MTFAEKLAEASGLTALTLYTNELMTENVRYYGKIGYTETARRTEDGYRRVYMRKALTPPRADDHEG
jgi:ribosomal protein S18 acetylase RimI-like enzyme